MRYRKHRKTRKTKKRIKTYKLKGGASNANELVSIVIPTYNRLKYLLNTIENIRKQTYKNIEIIVVNDKSTNEEYYTHTFDSDVILINLEKNTKDIYGYPCAGHVRNEGIKRAKGKYVAFCDDDDIWLPTKLELQMAALKSSGCKMSSTEGLIGDGPYNKDAK